MKTAEREQDVSTVAGSITRAKDCDTNGITWGCQQSKRIVWCVGLGNDIAGSGHFARFARKCEAVCFSDWLADNPWDGEGWPVFRWETDMWNCPNDAMKIIRSKYKGEV